MRSQVRFSITVILLLFLQQVFSQPMSGTYTIGAAPSSYTTLTSAFSALATRGMSAPVILEIKNGYVSENATIRPVAITGSSRTNTITVRPAAGSSLITLSGGTGSVFLLDNIDNLIIDGRPGGTGASRGIFMRSTANGTPALLTLGDVQNVVIRNCSLIANNDNSSNGLLNITSSLVTEGCDNWTITECEFIGNGLDASNNPIGSNNMIYVTGITTNPHDTLIITNNIFRDMFSPTNAGFTHNGIYVVSNVRYSVISGNSVYMTMTPSYTVGSSVPIWGGIRVGATCSKVTVSNNFVGGTAASAGGNKATLTGRFTVRGIDVGVSTGDTIRVFNNVVSNFDVTVDTVLNSSNIFVGINVAGTGNAEIGTAGSNTIGSISSNGAILIKNNASTDNSIIVGINATNTGFIDVQNNRIGSISVSATNSNIFNNLYGINYSGATIGSYVTISNNTIGSTTLPNSIQITNGNSTTQFNIRGINASTASSATVPEVSIFNNTISNIRFAPSVTNTGATMAGIYANPQNTAATTYKITGNRIFHLAGASDRTNTSTSMAMNGIVLTNSNAAAQISNPTVSNNTIYGLTNTSTSALNTTTPPAMGGIVFSNSTTTAARVTCERNLIHGLNCTATNTGSTAPIISGIHNNSVNLFAANNVIRLGLDTNGTAITAPLEIRGFYKNTAQPSHFSHNTVYITGSGVVDGNNAVSAAYYRASGNNLDTVSNNILINKRSNANVSGTGKHYAIRLSGTNMSYIGYNLYFANGNGGILGTVTGGAADFTSIGAWRNVMTADNFSSYGDATFTNANGNTASLNLLPTTANNLFSAAIAQVTTDYNNTARSASIPTAGAYELSAKPGVWKASAPNTSWTTASNWESGSVPSPTGGVNIFIPESTVNVPVVSTNVRIGRLVNATDKPLTVNSNITFSVEGDFQMASNGVVNATDANINLIGTQPQAINGIINVKNLSINNAAGVTITGGVVNIGNRLTPSLGTLTANGRLVFLSNLTGTATIGTGSGTVSGNVITQRFVIGYGRVSTLFLGSPVTARIDTSLQKQIHITGAVGTCPAVSAGGFDMNTSGTPSMFTFNTTNPVGSQWMSISNTNATALTPTVGYRVLVRGPRSLGCSLIDGTSIPIANVTLEANGPLTQGDVSETLNQGYNFLANPYQAPINFDNLFADNSSNMDRSFWTYYPEINNGAYTVYNAGVAVNLPQGLANDIPVGQAFFVRKTTAGPTTVNNFFRETQKSTGVPAQNGGLGTLSGFIRVGLKNNNDLHLDETVVRFSGTSGISNTVEGQYDAPYISESSEGISSIKSSNRYSIQTRTTLTLTDTVNLHIASTNNGTYKLNFTELQTGGINAFLVDKFLNQQQPISEGNSYSFAVTNDAASKGNRFYIVFTSPTLPTSFTAIYAKSKEANKAADVIWKVASDEQVNRYEVERSTDGRNFKQIGTKQSMQSSDAVSYTYTDNQPVNGTVFFRVKAVTKDVSYKYSAVARLNSKANSIELSLYPNPVEGQLNVQLSQPVKGQIYVNILNNKGQVVYQQSGLNAETTNLLHLNVARLAKGTYQLVISNGNDFTANASFIK